MDWVSPSPNTLEVLDIMFPKDETSHRVTANISDLNRADSPLLSKHLDHPKFPKIRSKLSKGRTIKAESSSRQRLLKSFLSTICLRCGVHRLAVEKRVFASKDEGMRRRCSLS